jgi:hypothetical protein
MEWVPKLVSKPMVMAKQKYAIGLREVDEAKSSYRLLHRLEESAMITPVAALVILIYIGGR